MLTSQQPRNSAITAELLDSHSNSDSLRGQIRWTEVPESQSLAYGLTNSPSHVTLLTAFVTFQYRENDPPDARNNQYPGRIDKPRPGTFPFAH